jgi:iron(III) transport system ATP-binding protein
MVFQGHTLYPHLSVYGNLAFPLVLRKIPKADRDHRVRQAATMLGIERLLDRKPRQLSGGEQQRVALGRAIVRHPACFLLDEPLSNLDAKLREEMRFELKRLQHELGITTVFVTHDQAEALVLSDAMAVMRDGQMEQVGDPREIYERPASRFVADFIGAANLIEGRIERRDADGLYAVTAAAGALHASSPAFLATGTGVTVVVRPEHVRVRLDDRSTPNGWRGIVSAQAFLGDAVEHVIRVGELELRARGNPALAIPPGAEVSLSFADGSCLLIPTPA